MARRTWPLSLAFLTFALRAKEEREHTSILSENQQRNLNTSLVGIQAHVGLLEDQDKLQSPYDHTNANKCPDQ